MNASGQAVETILKLLDEQRNLLKQWPYTAEQVRQDKEICLRLRDICDQLNQPESVSGDD